MKLLDRLVEMFESSVVIDMPEMPTLGKLDFYEAPTQEEINEMERRVTDAFSR